MSFFKHVAEYDVGELSKQIANHPELWDAHTVRKTAPNTPHSRMSDIWVRYNDVDPFEKSGDYRTFNDRHVPIWYPAWTELPALRPILFDLLAQVEGEMIGGVLITRIPPGGRIDPHSDKGWHVDYYDKFYVAIHSPKGARFHDESGEFLEPSVGSVYRYDNRREHSVTNSGTTDRVTLIVCIRTDKYLGEPR